MTKKIYKTQTINLTTDYSCIELMDTVNRKVRVSNVNNIKRSMVKKDLSSSNPIIVFRNPKKKGKFLVIDGQHRLTASKELNLPIYFIIDETIKTVKQAGDAILLLNNNSKSYTVTETLQTRLDLGDDKIKTMEAVLNDANLSKVGLGLGVSLLFAWQLGGNVKRALTAGHLKINHEEKVRALGVHLDSINFHNKYTQAFVMFIVRIMKSTESKKEIKRLLRLVRKIDWAETPGRSRKEYINLFLEHTGEDLR